MTDPAVAQPKTTKPWYMKWWVWLIAAVVILGGIGNLVNPAPKVEMPDLTGLPAAEASEQLKELGFKVTLKSPERTVLVGDDYDVESSDPAAGKEVAEGSRVTLNVVEATERLAAEAAEEERVKEEEQAKKEADRQAAEEKRQAEAAEASVANDERGAALEQSIKNAFGGAEFTELLIEDPTMWAGWISDVRVEGSNAYIRLQLIEEGKEDDIGKRAAQALSTLLSKDDVAGISWLIVEDATGTVIGQKQPAPIF